MKLTHNRLDYANSLVLLLWAEHRAQLFRQLACRIDGDDTVATVVCITH